MDWRQWNENPTYFLFLDPEKSFWYARMVLKQAFIKDGHGTRYK